VTYGTANRAFFTQWWTRSRRNQSRIEVRFAGKPADMDARCYPDDRTYANNLRANGVIGGLRRRLGTVARRVVTPRCID